jgi:phosphoglycolate phosphatase-like HAD superfamily hydrolase
VIWDWNGTLLDDSLICVDATNHAFRGIAGITVDRQMYQRNFTRPVRKFYERLLGRVVTDTEWHQIAHDFHAHYETAVRVASLRSGGEEILGWVAARGMTQSLLSMAAHEQLAAQVERHSLGRYFLLVHGSRGTARTESKRLVLPEHLARVARLRGRPLPPDSVLLVGDTVDDAEAAAAAGVRCVLLADGQHDQQSQEALGYQVAACLRTAVGLAGHEPRRR